MQMVFKNKTLIIGGWLWVMLTGLLLQLWVIPATPWHAGHGLLAGGDWVQFQEQALRLAAAIENAGWSAWELRFEGQAAVDVARRIGVNERLLWLVVLPFVFPSSLLIFGQIHKDILSLPGVLLIAWGWVMVLTDKTPKARFWFHAAMASVAGVLLVWWVRPYQAQLLLMTGFLIGIGAAISAAAVRRWAAAAGPVLVLTVMMGTYGTAEKLTAPAAPACATWQPEVTIPAIGGAAASLFCYRHHFIRHHPGEAANIDHDRLLTNYGEAVRYLPRALQIGLLAPFPTHWLGEASSPGGQVKRLLGGVEMLGFYVLLMGLIWAFRPVTNTWGVAALSVIGIGGILFYAYSSPNVGALYRYRFPFLMLLILIAALGWSNRLTAIRGAQGV